MVCGDLIIFFCSDPFLVPTVQCESFLVCTFFLRIFFSIYTKKKSDGLSFLYHFYLSVVFLWKSNK